MSYKSIHTGQQIDAGVSAALNPDTTPTASSNALMTSGGTKSAINSVENDIAIRVVGNKTTYASGAAIGQYVIVDGSTITGITDGLYKAAKTIPYNTVIDSTYLTAVSGGGLNDLLKVEDIRSEITFNFGGAKSAVRSGNIITINYRIGSGPVAADTVLFTVPTKYIPYILRNNLIWGDDTLYFTFASYDDNISSCQIAAKTNGEFKVVGKGAPPYTGGNIVYMI